MPPKDAPVAVLIDQEKWPTICGEEAEPNFLVVLEPFNKWCGPSEAILSTLARINRDLPHRRIKFMQMEATADIPELEKFTKISRPHFLFFETASILTRSRASTRRRSRSSSTISSRRACWRRRRTRRTRRRVRRRSLCGLFTTR